MPPSVKLAQWWTHFLFAVMQPIFLQEKSRTSGRLNSKVKVRIRENEIYITVGFNIYRYTYLSNRKQATLLSV